MQEGFISKDVEPDELLHILLTIKDGATHFPREEVFIEELTDGERKVLELVASGVRRREIAEQLFISERTVSNHLQHIFEKLQFTQFLLRHLQSQHKRFCRYQCCFAYLYLP